MGLSMILIRRKCLKMMNFMRLPHDSEQTVKAASVSFSNTGIVRFEDL